MQLLPVSRQSGARRMEEMLGEEPQFPGEPQNQVERQPQYQCFGGKMSHMNTQLQETYLAYFSSNGQPYRNASHGRLALPGVGPAHHKGSAGGSSKVHPHKPLYSESPVLRLRASSRIRQQAGRRRRMRARPCWMPHPHPRQLLQAEAGHCGLARLSPLGKRTMLINLSLVIH